MGVDCAINGKVNTLCCCVMDGDKNIVEVVSKSSAMSKEDAKAEFDKEVKRLLDLYDPEMLSDGDALPSSRKMNFIEKANYYKSLQKLDDLIKDVNDEANRLVYDKIMEQMKNSR